MKLLTLLLSLFIFLYKKNQVLWKPLFINVSAK